MLKSYKKKPLAEWPNGEKHKAAQPLEEADSETAEGHESDPEVVNEKTVLERAKEMGLYKNSTEDNQEEVNLAEEEKEDIKEEHHT